MPKVTFTYDSESGEISTVKIPKEWDELSNLAKADIFCDLGGYFVNLGDAYWEKAYNELKTKVVNLDNVTKLKPKKPS